MNVWSADLKVKLGPAGKALGSPEARLSRMVELADGLESPPLVACKLMELYESDSSMEEAVNVVRLDPALTAKMLRVCNSVSFGRRRKVSSVEDALAFLGFAKVLKIIWPLSVGGSMMGPLPSYGLPRSDLWHHSVVTALSAQEICRIIPEPPAKEGVAFTAGLLHDIGKVVLNHALQVNRDRFVKLLMEDDATVTAAEKAVTDFDHAQVGSAVLEKWNLPEDLTGAVRFHHQPGEGPPTLASVVLLANHCAHAMGSSFGRSSTANHALAYVMDHLQIGLHDIDQVMMRVVKRWDEVKGFLHENR